MTDHLHPQRETYPLVNTDDELVMVFRHHIVAPNQPVLYIKGLTEAEFRLDYSRSLDDRAGFEVLDYTAGGTETVTLTVNGGANTVLTEGTEFAAATSNAQTAINIADAINTAAIGLTATFDEGSAFVYVAPTPNAGVKEFTLVSSEPLAWISDSLASVGTLQTLGQASSTSFDVPTTDPTKQVGFLKIFSGKLSVDLRSPIEVRTYFRQPATLSGNTGHPGGWPTTP